jgi:hypothetical protein
MYKALFPIGITLTLTFIGRREMKLTMMNLNDAADHDLTGAVCSSLRMSEAPYGRENPTRKEAASS